MMSQVRAGQVLSLQSSLSCASTTNDDGNAFRLMVSQVRAGQVLSLQSSLDKTCTGQAAAPLRLGKHNGRAESMLQLRRNNLQGSLSSRQAKVLCSVLFASQGLSWVEVPPAVACNVASKSGMQCLVCWSRSGQNRSLSSCHLHFWRQKHLAKYTLRLRMNAGH